MEGIAGIVNGQLHLSQGITRTLAPADGNVGQFTEIPIIDLSPMTSPTATPEDKSRLTAEIRDACMRVGFFIVKNHSIDWKIVENAFDALKEFFGLPMEKKMEVHESKSDSFQGYEEPYCTNVDRLKKGGMFLSQSEIYQSGANRHAIVQT
jgi:isopenicillin N synthase-like dioxygenase